MIIFRNFIANFCRLKRLYVAWLTILFVCKFVLWAGIVQSIQKLVTGWTVRGSNAGGGEIFRNRPERPWGPPSILYNGYRVFSVGKAAGTWRWPPTPSSAEVKERIELYLYSLSGPSWPVQGWIYVYFMYVCASLSSPISEVIYEFINKSFESCIIAPDIKELAAKIQQQISH